MYTGQKNGAADSHGCGYREKGYEYETTRPGAEVGVGAETVHPGLAVSVKDGAGILSALDV